MFQIPEKKREYWNHKSATFLDEIKKVEVLHSKDQTKPVDDDTIVLKPTSIKSLYEYSTDCDDHIVGVSYINEGLKYHINNELCEEVEKCVNDFYKIKNIKNKISKDSLHNIVLSWLFETKIKEQISIEITQYIEEELHKRIKEYVVYFPLPYLEANKTYLFAKDISIGELPNVNLRSLLTSFKEEIYNQNTTFIYTKLEGERQAVIDMAYERCSLAIDMIKTCYLTFYSDFPKVCFDIANNVKKLPVDRCFIQELSSDNSLHINEDINIHFIKLDENFIRKLEDHCIEEYSVFFDRIYNEENTELEKVLLSAIRAYSLILSNSNYYDKIVDLCSIMDSLILIDEKESIKQALKKYVPLIITDSSINRRAISENIEKMYDIRSKYIHHRNTEKVITKKNIFDYSIIVFNLITQLVILTNIKKFNTMKDIIQVIDEKLKSTIENISFECELSQ